MMEPGESEASRALSWIGGGTCCRTPPPLAMWMPAGQQSGVQAQLVSSGTAEAEIHVSAEWLPCPLPCHATRRLHPIRSGSSQRYIYYVLRDAVQFHAPPDRTLFLSVGSVRISRVAGWLLWSATSGLYLSHGNLSQKPGREITFSTPIAVYQSTLAPAQCPSPHVLWTVPQRRRHRTC
jgi:hypothetical protein